MDYTIDELARAAETTVRSVRVYHERGLLPSPEVRGRTGYYGHDHLNRLQTISRLLSRGMKLNGIRELLEAWDRGEGLGDLLGVSEPAAPDEPPAAPTPPGDLIDFDAFAPTPPPDPNRRELTDRLIDTGLSPTAAMEFVDRLSSDCDRLAARYADSLFDHLAREDQGRTEQDHTVRAADSAIARLISERAMSAMLDRAPRPADSPAPR